MLVSTRIISSRIQGPGSNREPIDPDARRGEDGRRQGDPWRRPRLAEIRAKEAEQRAASFAASHGFRAAAVHADTVRPDTVVDAPFAALARTTEFWALLGAARPDVAPRDGNDPKAIERYAEASIDELFARVIATA